MIEAFRFYVTKVDTLLYYTEDAFLDEFRRWKDRFLGVPKTDLPKNASEAFFRCEKIGKEWFPAIHVLLKV